MRQEDPKSWSSFGCFGNPSKQAWCSSGIWEVSWNMMLHQGPSWCCVRTNLTSMTCCRVCGEFWLERVGFSKWHRDFHVEIHQCYQQCVLKHVNTRAKVYLKRKHVFLIIICIYFWCGSSVDSEESTIELREKGSSHDPVKIQATMPRMWGVDWGRTPWSILPAVCTSESQGTRCLLQWLCFAPNVATGIFSSSYHWNDTHHQRCNKLMGTFQGSHGKIGFLRISTLNASSPILRWAHRRVNGIKLKKPLMFGRPGWVLEPTKNGVVHQSTNWRFITWDDWNHLKSVWFVREDTWIHLKAHLIITRFRWSLWH